jgi:hypothetical protein
MLPSFSVHSDLEILSLKLVLFLPKFSVLRPHKPDKLTSLRQFKLINSYI